jgi:hypothetical protein
MKPRETLKALRKASVLYIRVIHTDDDDCWVKAVKSDYAATLAEIINEAPHVEIKAHVVGTTLYIG